MEDPRSVSVEYSPAISCASFHMPFVDLNAEDAARIGHIAATDGCKLYSGPKFETYTKQEQRFIFQHEMMHAILAHGPRAKMLHQSQGYTFDKEKWNIACDAIINEALSKDTGTNQSKFSTPKGLIHFGQIVRDLGLTQMDFGEEVDALLPTYSAETLYYALVKDCKEKCKSRNSRGKQNPGQKGQSQSQGQGKNESQGKDQESGGDKKENKEGHKKGCACHDAEHLGDVLEPGDFDDEGNPQSAEDLTREWQARQSIIRGLRPELFERLAGEFPEIKTPWDAILRDYLHRILGPRIETNWSRPSRRYSAVSPGYRGQFGCDFPFEPARDRPKVTGKIAVVLDTSGSIGSDLLNRFLSEIAAVIEMTDSKVTIITCDAAVHELHEIEDGSDADTLRGLTYSGGGGTAFEPGIKAAAETEPDAIIYLTDLYGSFGEDPGIETLWAIPKECNAVPGTVPFGRILQLD